MKTKSKNNEQTDVAIDENNNIVEMNENDNIEENDIDYDVHEEENESDEEILYSDLVVRSKKKKSRSKKTIGNNLVCEADSSFVMMHGHVIFHLLVLVILTTLSPKGIKKQKKKFKFFESFSSVRMTAKHTSKQYQQQKFVPGLDQKTFAKMKTFAHFSPHDTFW
jgi:hypothetical protein